VSFIKDNLHDMVWEHLRHRKHSPIPETDYDLSPCKRGIVIGNFTVGKVLGEGASGKVWKLENQRNDASSGLVVKAITKTSVASIRDFQDINEVEVMKALSSKSWQHPNIIKLYEVYHSGTHVLLQMEDGGSRNLHQVLRSLEIKQLPLGMAKAESIMTQTLGSI